MVPLWRVTWAPSQPHPLLRSFGAFPDCILSKLNSHGPHHASFMKKRIADYCGVAYKEAHEDWMAVIEAEGLVELVAVMKP